MVGWRNHDAKRGSGRVQRRVKRVIAELRLKEFTTREVMEYCFPKVRPETPAYLHRRRRLRYALHDMGAMPIARSYRGGFTWILKSAP
jgi:hypothetical protein